MTSYGHLKFFRRYFTTPGIQESSITVQGVARHVIESESDHRMVQTAPEIEKIKKYKKSNESLYEHVNF